MKQSFTLEKLAREIGGEVQGDGSVQLTGVAPLDSASETDLAFVTNPRYAKTAAATQARVILCDREIPGLKKSFLLSANPYAALAKVISLFHPAVSLSPGVREGAWIDPKAHLHPQASIAAGATVSSGAKVGARTVLYPGVFLGENAVVGEDCLLYPNATVRENCVLGDRVVLQPGAVVGSDGFGFAKEGDGYLKVPQVGNVILESDVELGANTCVDRAVLGSTRIGKGSKLDNLIQVGHNVIVGNHTVIAAQAGISGSTQIGSHVMIGGQVGLAGHLKIGDQVILGAQAGVIGDVLEKGVYWGTPSQEKYLEIKMMAACRQLPELLKKIRSLEKALEKLEGLKRDEK